MILANIGIPVVCIAVPTMLIALLPIAGIETVCYRFGLQRAWSDAFRGAFLVNILSTLVGVPLIWLVMLIGQIAIGGDKAWGMETPQQQWNAVTLQAAWLIPYSDHIGWMIPAASIVLLFPFYLGSILLEGFLLTRRWPFEAPKRLFTVVTLANTLSYLVLGIYYSFQLWLAVR